ncbi:MAG: DUF4139 domain-containing protein [Treponema sp.]|jgi:hypothetical protein|nr:DUF4139 domain-containing protein [Treponema sp.]
MKLHGLFLAFLILLSDILPNCPAVFAQASSEPNTAASGGVRSTAAETLAPLRHISLFSSGVGFFEHSGSLSGSANIDLVFNTNAVNDALKSLVVNDPLSPSPSVHYPSEQTLYRTLKSLAVDLSGNPGMAEVLGNLRGAEIEIYAPSLITGRILGVEQRVSPRPYGESGGIESYLSLFTGNGIKVIGLKEISSYSFKDPRINADLGRALDLIMASRAQDTRTLKLSLPGEGRRDVSLSYVVPTPVWKVSYRLDLSRDKPFLQGWAIVDNDSDTDWNNVNLSLVTGKPVSFIQNLYAPYRLSRPTLPLAIAGIAQAETYASGADRAGTDLAAERAQAAVPRAQNMAAAKALAVQADEAYESPVRAPVPAPAVAGGMESAAGAAAGDQFEFSFKKPVSLARQESAMLPLVEGPVLAEKTLVFSVSRARSGMEANPAISTELTNTTGMKLPAGPITVYDQTYAGDALIEFFPENEKRIISYGDDLTVTGSVSNSSSRFITAVTITGGVMTITRKQSYEKTYSFRNASAEQKKLIVEHPITQGAVLTEPASYSEKTASLYRFSTNLPAGFSGAQSGAASFSFKVKEEMPVSERITLSTLRLDSFISYASNQEIPANVRNALRKAVELKQKADAAEKDRAQLDSQRTRLVSEQDRTRRNLEAAGSQTQQGQEYLRRMTAQDAEIDALSVRIDAALKLVQAAQQEYDAYIAGLKL